MPMWISFSCMQEKSGQHSFLVLLLLQPSTDKKFGHMGFYQFDHLRTSPKLTFLAGFKTYITLQ
jgi:hypothetical protein